VPPEGARTALQAARHAIYDNDYVSIVTQRRRSGEMSCTSVAGKSAAVSETGAVCERRAQKQVSELKGRKADVYPAGAHGVEVRERR